MAENVVGLLEVVEIDAEDGELAAIRIRLFDDALQLEAERRPVWQIGQGVVMGEMGDLLVPGDQLGARRLHVVARLVEAERGLPHLLLQEVEALSHLAELVAGIRLHRHDVDRGMRGLEIAAPERRHRVREMPQRPRGQALGGFAHFGRRVGDHARQHEADADGEQGDGDEDVGQRRHELGMCSAEMVLTATR